MFVARSLGFSRYSFYTRHVLEDKDLQLKNKIDRLYETDDTLGPKKVSKLLGVNKKRALRVMRKYGVQPRRQPKRYRYAGKASQISENLLLKVDLEKYEVIFSDILEFKLADESKVYCCFIIRRFTRQILAFSYGYSMPAELVVETLEHVPLVAVEDELEVIYHSDQGSQYGAKMTIEKLAEQGFIQSMSRAGTPTDNGIAERFVSTFKLAVVKRYKYETIGEFAKFAEQWLNFYNERRPHESTRMLSPNDFARKKNLLIVSYLSVKSV